MSSIIEKLAAEGHLSDEQVERIGRRVAEMVKAARTDAKFLKEAQEKVAVAPPVVTKLLSRLGQGAVLGLGVTSGAKAVSMISEKIRERNEAVAKAQRYKSMIEANPGLRSAGVDAKMVQRHFDTLHKFNPEYASDPMVAGTYVQSSLDYARPNIETLNNVVRARADFQRAEGARSQPGERLLKPVAEIGTALLKPTAGV
jgi:hypothetical protein